MMEVRADITREKYCNYFKKVIFNVIHSKWKRKSRISNVKLVDFKKSIIWNWSIIIGLKKNFKRYKVKWSMYISIFYYYSR